MSYTFPLVTRNAELVAVRLGHHGQRVLGHQIEKQRPCCTGTLILAHLIASQFSLLFCCICHCGIYYVITYFACYVEPGKSSFDNSFVEKYLW